MIRQDDRPRCVVFDIGRVLIEWDPRHLYRRMFASADEMEWFLANVCTPAWNRELDRGLPFDEAIAERTACFPVHRLAIEAYRDRWQEMVPHAIEGSVAILEALRRADVPTYAITNFAGETFRATQRRFPFLAGFDGAIVSGDVGLLKPDPRIYRLLLERYGLDAAECVFMDDVPANVAAARSVGMHGIDFTDPPALRRDLAALGFPLA